MARQGYLFGKAEVQAIARTVLDDRARFRNDLNIYRRNRGTNRSGSGVWSAILGTDQTINGTSFDDVTFDEEAIALPGFELAASELTINKPGSYLFTVSLLMQMASPASLVVTNCNVKAQKWDGSDWVDIRGSRITDEWYQDARPITRSKTFPVEVSKGEKIKIVAAKDAGVPFDDYELLGSSSDTDTEGCVWSVTK